MKPTLFVKIFLDLIAAGAQLYFCYLAPLIWLTGLAAYLMYQLVEAAEKENEK